MYILLFLYCALQARVRCQRFTNTPLHYTGRALSFAGGGAGLGYGGAVLLRAQDAARQSPCGHHEVGLRSLSQQQGWTQGEACGLKTVPWDCAHFPMCVSVLFCLSSWLPTGIVPVCLTSCLPVCLGVLLSVLDCFLVFLCVFLCMRQSESCTRTHAHTHTHISKKTHT